MVQILRIQMGHVVLLGIQKPEKMVNQLQSLIMVTALTSKFYLTGFFQREFSIKPNLHLFVHIVAMI